MSKHINPQPNTFHLRMLESSKIFSPPWLLPFINSYVRLAIAVIKSMKCQTFSSQSSSPLATGVSQRVMSCSTWRKQQCWFFWRIFSFFFADIYIEYDGNSKRESTRVMVDDIYIMGSLSKLIQIITGSRPLVKNERIIYFCTSVFLSLLFFCLFLLF